MGSRAKEGGLYGDEQDRFYSELVQCQEVVWGLAEDSPQRKERGQRMGKWEGSPRG